MICFVIVRDVSRSSSWNICQIFFGVNRNFLLIIFGRQFYDFECRARLSSWRKYFWPPIQCQLSTHSLVGLAAIITLTILIDGLAQCNIYPPDTEYVNFLYICLFRQSFEEH